jgi:glucose/arabinose dehydrogenase
MKHRLERFSPTIRVAAAVIGLMIAMTEQARGEFDVERVVGGLNQPIHMAQAPGDSGSIYIVERADSGNQLGRIQKYDFQTGSFTTFLDLSGTIFSDGGILSLTFHPQYQTNGLFYVVSNDAGTNRLDEYRVVASAPQFQRRLLQYQNLDNVFHTLNQVHFRPNGNNNELFVTAGDGGTQANDPDFDIGLIEDPNSPYGKLMRINLAASFPTPANGPSHPGVDVVALGLRNPYRSSFDRQTGDFYLGDVGFNSAEEIDFIPASHFTNPSAPLLNFGWTDREGTGETQASQAGGPGSPGDINPIFDYAHSASNVLPHPSVFLGQSITAGYLYRGAAPEFQGRYFFSDFVNGNVYSGTFNTSTPTSSFNGANLTNIQNHTSDFESRVAGGANIQFVTSFAEDNAGNLYVVKFGDAFFPPLGQGEIFRIVPVLSGDLRAEINRNTGAITILNPGGAPVAFTSLTIASSTGAIDPDELTPITGNYDINGNGTIDSNNAWNILSTAGSHTQFREATTGDAGALAAGSQLVMSPAGGWIRSPIEDLIVSFVLNGGSVLNLPVAYTGNSGQPFARSDLNFNGGIDVADWSIFLANGYTNLAGVSQAESYGRGDLDGDGDNDRTDFQLFKSDYNSANGSGAFEAMLARVPEPGALLLLVSGFAAILLAASRSPRRSQVRN